MRSEVRRWSVFEIEQVRHRQLGQEWMPHWHAEWSVGAAVRGECRCSVGTQPLHLRRSDLIAIAPETVHTGALVESAGTQGVLVVMVYVPQAWFASQGLQAPPGSGRIHAPELAQAAQHLRSCADVQRWLPLAVQALRDGLPPQQRDGHPSAAAREVLDAVRSAVLGGPVSVTELARHCAVSRERLHRVVRRWTGMSPSAYLRTIRVNRAREMLLAGEPMSSIAAACGFCDQAHFTRWFRKSFGYTPGDLCAAANATDAAIDVRASSPAHCQER